MILFVPPHICAGLLTQALLQADSARGDARMTLPATSNDRSVREAELVKRKTNIQQLSPLEIPAYRYPELAAWSRHLSIVMFESANPNDANKGFGVMLIEGKR